MAGPNTQPLPHSVAEQEARVEDRNHRPLARHELAVDPDQDALVAVVRLEVVRAVGDARKPRSAAAYGPVGGGSFRLPGERRPSRMISTSRGQRPVAGPIVACVIRPSPQAIIGMSSQWRSRRSSPES